MGKEYDHTAHGKYRIRYHIILSTKYRRKCLSGLEDALTEAFAYASSRCEFKVLSVGADVDHVHLLVRSTCNLSPVMIIRRLKGLSTRYMWEHHGDVLSKHYWGDRKRLWSGGYFCSTVGEVSEENITRYIENQG